MKKIVFEGHHCIYIMNLEQTTSQKYMDFMQTFQIGKHVFSIFSQDAQTIVRCSSYAF